jgi:ABC-2 type transport system ATP-binding protein
VITRADARMLGASRPPATDAVTTTAESAPRLAVLDVTGVTKRWRSDRPPVLVEVDLTVRPGEVVGILGRNGAGKTTLLRIAAGLITADAGSVRLLGLRPQRDRAEYQRRLGFLSAGNSGLYGRLRVEHHLDLASALAYVPRETQAAAIDRVRRAFELDELLGQRVDRLSMGQRQRLRLALAFVHEPELALLDEPRTSLDADGVARVQAAVDVLTSRGGSALVCAPDAEDLGIECDRRLVVNHGRLEPA